MLIVLAWFLSDGMGRALRTRIETGATGFEGNTLHVWLGGAAFLLIILRLFVRATSGAPSPVPGSSLLMEAAATWGHRLLYLLMVLAPASGAIAWYGGVREAGEAHELLTNALMIVALGHALAAIYHQAVLKDGVMERMRRPAD